MGCYKEMTQYEEQWTCKKCAHIHHGEKETGGNKNETRQRFQSSASQQHQRLQVFIILFYIVFYAQAANDNVGIDVTWIVLLEKNKTKLNDHSIVCKHLWKMAGSEESKQEKSDLDFDRFCKILLVYQRSWQSAK